MLPTGPSSWTCDLMTEPRGRLLDELYRKVTELGWQSPKRKVPAKTTYEIGDLVDCAENDADIVAFYHAETIRSVVQPLRTFQRKRTPLFSGQGTPIRQLLREGTMTINSIWDASRPRFVPFSRL